MPSRLINIDEKIICKYRNNTKKFKIIKINNKKLNFERVVIPNQEIVFEATNDSHLEIHTYEIVTAIFEDRIPCIDLCLK